MLRHAGSLIDRLHLVQHRAGIPSPSNPIGPVQDGTSAASCQYPNITCRSLTISLQPNRLRAAYMPWSRLWPGVMRTSREEHCSTHQPLGHVQTAAVEE